MFVRATARTSAGDQRNLGLTLQSTQNFESPREHMEDTVSIVKEELEIGTRTVETGRVRIAKRVEEHEQTVGLPLRYDEVQIERVTLDREVDHEQGPRHEGDVMIVPILRRSARCNSAVDSQRRVTHQSKLKDKAQRPRDFYVTYRADRRHAFRYRR